MNNFKKMNISRKGSVLILTLIIMTFLSALALQLGHFMRSKNIMIRNYQNDISALHIAQGAINKVINQMERDKKENTLDYLNEDWIKGFMRDDNTPKIFQWRGVDNRIIGEYAVRIADESSKINVNIAGVNDLQLLLDDFVSVDSHELARRIINYRDSKGVNKVFYSVYELLLLNGIEKDVLLGEDANENGYVDTQEEEKNFLPEVDHYDQSAELGLKDYMTVVTNGKVNLNTAGRSVLLSMPGMNEDIVDDLINQRRQSPFALLDDIKAMNSISAATFTKIVRWASVQSDWYKVVVNASIEGSHRNKIIVAIIDRSGSRSKIKYWREN